VGTELLISTGKPIENATVEIFDKAHGLHFFTSFTPIFSFQCSTRGTHCDSLTTVAKITQEQTRQVKRTQMVATARFTIRVCFNFFRLLRIERKETVARKDVRFKPEPLPQRLHEEGFTFAQGT